MDYGMLQKNYTLFGSDNGSAWTNLGSDSKTIQDYNGNGNNGWPMVKHSMYKQH